MKKLPLYLFGILTMGFASCESEDPVPENDQEVITELILTFVEVNQTLTPIGTPFSAIASDPEGIEVGSAPIVQPINLETGKSYVMTIQVLNGIEGENITEEILAEADEHQFYFLGDTFSQNAIAISYIDPSGKNLGLENILSTSNTAFTGQWRVVLRHDLDKSFPGATSPNFENFVQAGGESDLDITFPVVIN
jgi:hypothetical protein